MTTTGLGVGAIAQPSGQAQAEQPGQRLGATVPDFSPHLLDHDSIP
jgi:hypothetical protein